jgi:O-antigen/teichoic acid export membrane protein
MSRMSLRRPLGILGLLLFLCVYALAAVALFEPVAGLHPLLQAPVWLVLGVAWVFPLKPVLRWIETGRARPPQ